MRLSNNIHNVCELEGAQLVQEWKEEEKIPVKKATPPPAPKPKPEEAKKEEADKPKEGEAGPTPPPEGGAPADGEQKPQEPAAD